MQVKCIGTGSNGNCYLVNLGSGWVILDFGCLPQKVYELVNANDIELGFLSHEHSDHNKFISRFKGFPIVRGNLIKDFTKISNFEQFRGVYSIWCFPLKHGNVNNAGLILKCHISKETLLYATDFTVCRYSLRDWKPTIVMVECNYLKANVLNDNNDFGRKIENIDRHLDLEGCIKFLNTLDLSECKEILLLHQSSLYGDEVTFASVIEEKFKIKTGVCQRYGGVRYYG